MYAVKITMHSGAVVRATVTKAALRSMNLKACASVSWSKVAS